MKQRQKIDVSVANHGTIWTFEPVSKQAKAWVEENVQIESYMHYGIAGFSADWRMGRDIAEGMAEAGLVVA